MISHRFLTLSILFSFLLNAPTQGQGVSTLLIENVTLIDGTGHPPVPGASILIADGKIRKVSRTRIDVDKMASRIDGQGKYLIPGLMDMHIHLTGGFGSDGTDEAAGLRALHGYLYCGITSVYDAGNNPDYILTLREKERTGQITSPRIFATGSLITVPGGHGGGTGATLVDSWPEAIAKLDEHIARKPDMVKFTFDEHGWGTRPMIPLLPVDLLQKMGQYFNERGVRTTVHASNE